MYIELEHISKYFGTFKASDDVSFGIEKGKLVGLPGVEKRYPDQLSGGQRQRIALARALAPQPEVLLLDEPFAAIDAKVRKELRTWLRETIDKVGITSIFVTHDQDEAIEIADEIIITNKGRIEQVGNLVEIYENPKTPFVAQFIGQSAVIKDFGKLKGFEKENDSQYGVIRPEFVEISDFTDNIKNGTNEVWKDKTAKDKKSDNETTIDAADSAYEDGIIEEVLFRGNTYEIRVRIGNITVTGKTSVSAGKRSRGEHIKVLIKQLYIIEDENTQIVKNKAFDDSQIYYI